MQTDYDTDDLGKAFFEETIRRIRQGAEFAWEEDVRSERFTVVVLGPAKSVKLGASREALHQAADDPRSRPKLAREIERQFRISESGRDGFVKEV